MVQPPVVASTALQTCGLELLETKIAAALCTIGAGGTLTLTFEMSLETVVMQCAGGLAQ